MHLLNGIEGLKTRAYDVVGLTEAEESELREALRKTTPSEAWVDAQIAEVIQTDQQGQAVVCRVHDRAAFPPGGVHTKMVRCAKCDIFNPPNAMERGDCLDHADERAHWGPSPSAMSIVRFQYYGTEGKNWEMPLPPESHEALMQEIRDYENLCQATLEPSGREGD